MVNNTDSFIKRANEVHNGFYSYDKSNYQGSRIPLVITCPRHGDFLQRPNDHLQGKGCKECGKEICSNVNIKYTTQSFIKKCKEIYGDKYDYSKTVYKGSHEKIICICKEHGEFEQYAYLMLQGHGCQKCGFDNKANKRRKTNEEFLKEARCVHGDKYEYLDEYIRSRQKIRIRCKRCGEVFLMTPFSHVIDKYGCKTCNAKEANSKRRITNDEFISKARSVHGDKYDYSKTKYETFNEKVEIVCNKCKNTFTQTPNKHLNGRGCPYCKASHLETKMRNLLIENDIDFIEQKRFDWLGLQSLDFFIPSKNIAIECQGEQHYRPIEFFGGVNHFNYVTSLDKKKIELCCANGIMLLYYDSETNTDSFIKKLR